MYTHAFVSCTIYCSDQSEIVKSLGYTNKFSDCCIRVITPYSAQRETIRGLLKDMDTEVFKEIVVGSVAETQGKRAYVTYSYFILL